MVSLRKRVRLSALPNKSFEGSDAGVACGCYLLTLLINLVVGGFCTDYSLWFYFGVSIPFWACALIGLVGGQFTIPLALIAWILHLCGVAAPLFYR